MKVQLKLARVGHEHGGGDDRPLAQETGRRFRGGRAALRDRDRKGSMAVEAPGAGRSSRSASTKARRRRRPDGLRRRGAEPANEPLGEGSTGARRSSLERRTS